ncbi:hypothetical protein V8E54_014553, partial [Elaphomyces granulatus]
AGPYSSWFVDIRLPPAANKALSAIVKTGPYKTYTPPNPYSLVRVSSSSAEVFSSSHNASAKEGYCQACPAFFSSARKAANP